MKLTVEMLAFAEPGETQGFEIPDAELAGGSVCQLEAGFQRIQDMTGLASISAGDAIYVVGNRYLVAGVGFRRLSEPECLDYQV
jgi:hypothetical protein